MMTIELRPTRHIPSAVVENLRPLGQKEFNAEGAKTLDFSWDVWVAECEGEVLGIVGCTPGCLIGHPPVWWALCTTALAPRHLRAALRKVQEILPPNAVAYAYEPESERFLAFLGFRRNGDAWEFAE